MKSIVKALSIVLLLTCITGRAYGQVTVENISPSCVPAGYCAQTLVSMQGQSNGDFTVNGDVLNFVTSESFATIRMSTTDAADNKFLAINGGGGTGYGRGGQISVYGNEVATDGGEIRLTPGDVATGRITLFLENAASAVNVDDVTTGNLLTINNAGDLIFNATNGGKLIQAGASDYLLSGAATLNTDLTTVGGRYYGVGASAEVLVNLLATAATATANQITLGKTRATDTSGNTIVADADVLGAITFNGADGVDFAAGATIRAIVSGTPGSNDMPAAVGILTSADGAQTPLLRLSVGPTGNITSDATNGGDFIFAGTGDTISVQEATAATACMGVATPNGTTPVAVTTSCATSGSRVFYTRVGAVTNMDTISTTTAPSGTGFSFASVNAADTLASSVVYLIVKESA